MRAKTNSIDGERLSYGMLVEHLRSTGYEGREPWIASLDPVSGTFVVAVRQMEACATQPACAWRDEVADEAGLWGFMRACLLEPLLLFAQIVELTIGQEPARYRESADKTSLFENTWKTVSRLLERLQNAEPTTTPYAETTVRFLVAVMVLRQIVDRQARPGTASDDAPFVPYSTNVHPTFLPNLMQKLGSATLELATPATLSDVCVRLEALSHV